MRDYRKHLVVLIAYTLIALAMTYPLILNFATAIPGVEGDAGSFVWALGWAKTALAVGANPFHTDYVFYPLGGATQLLWAVSLIAFASLPLQALFGLIVAHNLLYLAATVLTAYGMYLLAGYVLADQKFQLPAAKFDLPASPIAAVMVTQYLLAGAGAERYARLKRLPPRELPAFVAGIAFAFAPLRLGYGLSFLNLFNTEWIPFYVLFLLRAVRAKSWRAAMLAGILLGLNAYIDFQIAAFLILFTALYFVTVLGADQIRRIQLFALTAFVALIVAAPMLAIVANDFAAEGGNYIRVFPLKYSTDRAYDLLAYVLPNARSTLYANVPIQVAGVNAGVNATDGSALSPDRQTFVGWFVLALAAHAIFWRWRRARFWLLVACVFALFSLGPSLHILGRDTGIPLPYMLLHEIPIVNHIRIPMRYGIMVAFALALLAAIAVRDLQFKFHGTHYGLRWMRPINLVAWIALPAILLIEAAVLPYPVQAQPMPRIYETIARVPGDFTVLEIPTFNWRGAAASEVYQALDGKRILRAYTNRIAPDLAEYFGTRGTPIVVRSLRALEGADKNGLDANDLAEDKSVRDAVVRFYNVRYALVHRSYLTADQVRALDAYLRDVLNAQQIDDDGETIAYAVPPAPPQAAALTIDLRENIGQMYAGRGWQFEYPQADYDGAFKFVWARGAQSEIYFVSNGTMQTLTLNAYAESPQPVGVWLNDARIGEIALTSEWRAYTISLPASALHNGMNRVRLDYGAELKETVGVTTITIR